MTTEIAGLELTDEDVEQLFFEANAGGVLLDHLEELQNAETLDELNAVVDSLLNAFYDMVEEADGGVLH